MYTATCHEPFLNPSIGNKCYLPRLSAPIRIRIFSICDRWHIRNTNCGIHILFLRDQLDGSWGSFLQVGVFIGELIGHYANDAIMRVSTRRNHGFFEAESRLW